MQIACSPLVLVSVCFTSLCARVCLTNSGITAGNEFPSQYQKSMYVCLGSLLIYLSTCFSWNWKNSCTCWDLVCEHPICTLHAESNDESFLKWSNTPHDSPLKTLFNRKIWQIQSNTIQYNPIQMQLDKVQNIYTDKNMIKIKLNKMYQ